VPEEYKIKYKKELEESGYIALKEFTFPNFFKDASTKL
jgi:hypothetical protein